MIQTRKEINTHNNFRMSPESIARSLEHLRLDGSSWLIDNWQKEWRILKYDLIQAIKYDCNWQKISSNKKAIAEVKKWASEVTTWETIIITNDVAMFPKCLRQLKRLYLTHMDKEYCETVTRLSYNAQENELYHRALQSYRAEYGVFRLCSIIGYNLYNQLRRHLQVSDEEFTATYGERLLDDLSCCDEMIIEMLVNGRLTGAVRSYKIEAEFF